MSSSSGTVPDPGMDPEAREEDACPGEGKCHGCMRWCSTCGTVAQVCDARLDGKHCNDHPVPPPWQDLKKTRAAAERKVSQAKAMLHEGASELEAVEEQERVRRIYDRQLVEHERQYWLSLGFTKVS